MASPIVEDYAASLAELVFNLRPIIDNLTTIARENTGSAEGIVAAISSRIYKCIPEHKLFALYLLDSVCKIAGPPYNVLLGADIFKLFSHVYLLVNDQTRAKLVKLYDLWRVLKLKDGLPLFPPDQLDRIGHFLRQAGFQRAPPQAARQVSATSLIADIDTLFPHMQKRLAANGGDAALAGRCAALTELRRLLHSLQLKQNELHDIQERLAAMKQQELYTAPSTPAPAPVPTPQQLPAELVFADLIALGLVRVDQSLKPGLKPEYAVQLPRHKYLAASGAPAALALEQLLVDARLADKSQYEQIKFKELVKVLQKLQALAAKHADKPGAAGAALQQFVAHNTLDAATVQVLYETKLLKCSQCGKRFTGDGDGATRKRVHLDWHFRINKKLANFKTNVQLRNWYLDDLDWVRFNDNDLLEYEQVQLKKEATPVAVAKAQYVVIPSTETNMNNTCAICREQIKATYNDQLGEWVWDACMLAPGQNSGRKIVHVACFEELRKRGADESMEGRVKRERA